MLRDLRLKGITPTRFLLIDAPDDVSVGLAGSVRH
jgi:hypothetical protein